MLKSTMLPTVVFFFLVVGWAITPARADCPHNGNFNHRHCEDVPTASSVVVRDANGVFVGVVVETDQGRFNQAGGSLVSRQDMDTAVLFEVSEVGLTATHLTLFHESTDCSGPELMELLELGSPGLFVNAAARATTLYYSPTAVASVITRTVSFSPKTVNSCVESDEFFIPPNICCFEDGGNLRNVGPPRMIDLSDLVPPFHAEVQE